MDKKKETPHEKFIRIASSRTQKIIDMVRLLGNCSNKYVYEYSEEEVDKIFLTIEKELQSAHDKFKEQRKTKFKL